MQTITSYPNAKINLGLFVTERRDDGYHDLLSVFYPVESLHDELTITVDHSTANYTFAQQGIKVDSAPEDNLVIRAYRLMQELYGIRHVRIELVKNIPFGAGLGGGSADAAFTLGALNELFALGLSQQTLAAHAKKLGADCPFFIYNKPMLVSGIGDIFEPVNTDLGRYRIEVVKPDVSVSTAEAYRGIKPRAATCDPKHVVQNIPVSRWKDYLHNDFEDTIIPLHPEIGALKQQFYDRGALYASMSGSGSAVFGILENTESN